MSEQREVKGFCMVYKCMNMTALGGCILGSAGFGKICTCT